MAIVSDEQVIKVLRQYNSWRRSPSAIKEESKPYKRNAYYEALRMIKHKTLRRFAILSGARRVGKTTIMYRMIDNLIDEGVNPKNILYVSFDNPIVKLVNIDTVLSIYETLYPIEGTFYIFLDEIQYTDNWELWMKVIYARRMLREDVVDKVIRRDVFSLFNIRSPILMEKLFLYLSHIPANDAIVELCRDGESKVTSAFVVTKQLEDFGIAKYETKVPILRIPAIAFLYLLGSLNQTDKV